MKIIEPQVELWQQTDPIAHVARCARVCYGKKEGKSSDETLCNNLLKSRHNSMFRHKSIYAIIPKSFNDLFHTYEKLCNNYSNCPYIDYRISNEILYVATNGNWIIDDSSLIRDDILSNRVTPEEFANTKVGRSIMRYTFHIITQISTSRELNRVSPNNIAERSTRYVDESIGAICRPHWLPVEDVLIWNIDSTNGSMIQNPNSRAYLQSCDTSFRYYRELIKQGMKRENARGVLPLDTATEVVYTYSIDEWRHIIKLRSDTRAHPNCQIIANMIKAELEKLGYTF